MTQTPLRLKNDEIDNWNVQWYPISNPFILKKGNFCGGARGVPLSLVSQ